MAITIQQLAQAVTDELNAQSFSGAAGSFIARWTYLPVFDLKDMGVLHVTVVPRGATLAAAGRGLRQSDVQMDVGVQKKLSTTGNSEQEIDALMALVGEIGAFFFGRRLAAPCAGTLCVLVENSPIYSQEHLGELRQFTSVLTLTLRTMTEW